MYQTAQILDQFKKLKPQLTAVVKKLKKQKPQGLDQRFAEVHEQVFEHIDCLQCANCCKTTSPMLFEKDIERLSAHFRMKPGRFVEQYLFLDTDGVYAFRQTPCPFLSSDNFCSVYESRPKACQEYPHTNQRKMQTLLTLAEKNAEICPAVQRILVGLEGIK